MVSKAQKLRLGIFVIFSALVLIIFIVMVIGDQMMEKRDEYRISYEDVSVNGLQVGGAVKYHGINIGRVDVIKIDEDDIRNVIVGVSLKSGTPIKEDVQATLVPVGITGLKQIELTGGTNISKNLKPGSEIQAGKSSFENITGKAEVIAEKLELVLNNLVQFTGEENQANINSIIANIDSIIIENKKPVKNILTNIDSISNNLTYLTNSVNNISFKLENIMQNGKLDSIITNSARVSSDLANADIQAILANIDETVKSADETFNHIDLTVLKSRQDILKSIETLKETIDYLNEFSRRISENPGLLLRPVRKD